MSASRVIIDQAIYLIPQAGRPEDALRCGTLGVSDQESEFVRRFLLSGATDAAPPCRAAMCKIPAGRYVILYQTENGESVRAFFVDEDAFAVYDFHPFRLLDVVLTHPPANPLQPITIQDEVFFWPNADLELAVSVWTAGVLGNLLDCLLDSVLTGARLGILLAADARPLVATMYDLLPRCCRRELSFSGLSPSFSVYPFNMCFARDSKDAWRSMSELRGVSIVNLADNDFAISTHLRHPWSNTIIRLLSNGGQQACLDFVSGVKTASAFADLHSAVQSPFSCNDDGRLSTGTENITQAIGDYSGYCFQEDVHQPYLARRSRKPFAPDQHSAISRLDLSKQDVLEQLDQLDDALFDAIAGTNEGYARLEELWPQVKSHLASELVEESRDQYVRLIVDRCVQQLASEGSLDESTAQPAMHVLQLLFSNSPMPEPG